MAAGDRGGDVAALFERARAGDRGDRSIKLDTADAMGASVGDQNPAFMIDCESPWVDERGVRSRSAVRGRFVVSGTGDGADRPVKVDAADTAIAAVEDKDATIAVDRNDTWHVKESVRRRPAVA